MVISSVSQEKSSCPAEDYENLRKILNTVDPENIQAFLKRRKFPLRFEQLKTRTESSLISKEDLESIDFLIQDLKSCFLHLSKVDYNFWVTLAGIRKSGLQPLKDPGNLKFTIWDETNGKTCVFNPCFSLLGVYLDDLRRNTVRQWQHLATDPKWSFWGNHRLTFSADLNQHEITCETAAVNIRISLASDSCDQHSGFSPARQGPASWLLSKYQQTILGGIRILPPDLLEQLSRSSGFVIVEKKFGCSLFEFFAVRGSVLNSYNSSLSNIFPFKEKVLYPVDANTAENLIIDRFHRLKQRFEPMMLVIGDQTEHSYFQE